MAGDWTAGASPGATKSTGAACGERRRASCRTPPGASTFACKSKGDDLMRIDTTIMTVGLATLVLVVGGPLVAHAHTTPAQKCATAKSKAAAKKAAGKLKCYATATVHATQVDTACLTAAETKFGAAITKAEAAVGCAVTGDAGAIEAAVEAFVGAINTLTLAMAP